MRGIRKKVLLAVTIFLLCGISLTATIPMAVASADTFLYRIEPGDTLSRIARRFGANVDTLVALNGIADPHWIYAGDILLVPGQGGWAGPAFDYTVVRGDTLYEIAKRYGTTVKALASLNGIDNPNFIRAGQTLLIKPGQSGPPAPVNHYLVVKGDTLSRIARRFGVSVKRLVRRNGIENPNLIYIGQLLRID